jgi:hypothetical protein
MYYFSDRSEQMPIDTTVSFDDCHFEHNRAHVGSAVDFTPDIYVKQLTGHSTVPMFRNCKFWDNCVFCFIQRERWSNTSGLGTK